MKVAEFTGGKNTRVSPSLLNPNEAVKLLNADITSKVLKSVYEPKKVEGVQVSGYFNNFKDTWLGSHRQRSYAEYKTFIYWTEDGIKPHKFDGNRTSQVGIDRPLGGLVVSQTDPLTAPVSAPTTTAVASAGDGIDAATYTHCYTYYNSETGRESDKSPNATAVEVATGEDVQLADIAASAEEGVDTIRIYRTGDGISTMTLVKEVPNAADDVIDDVLTADLLPFELKTDVGISGSVETLQYVYTYYNSQDDIESAPSELSDEIEIAANKEVTISGIEVSEDIQVDKVRIYRTGDGATEFTLIMELDNDTDSLANLVDGVSTIDAIGSLLDSTTYFPPPENGRFITEAFGTMYMAVDSTLHFSIQGKPNYWPKTNTIEFARTITGIFVVSNGILIFSEGETDILLGNNPANFSVAKVSEEQGNTSHYSSSMLKGIPTWTSLDGICQYHNGYIKVISKDKLGKVRFPVVKSVVYDEQYWLCLTNGSLFVMDVRFGTNITFKSYRFSDNIDNISVHDDTLYGRQKDTLVTILNSSIGVSHRAFEYLSPIFTEGEHSQIKLYNVIYIRSDSDHEFGIEATFYIDDKKVLSKTLVGNDVHEVKIPQERQRGSGLQIKLTGVGTVYEYEYKVQGRQNGR